jgi:hypothetical protein
MKAIRIDKNNLVKLHTRITPEAFARLNWTRQKRARVEPQTPTQGTILTALIMENLEVPPDEMRLKTELKQKGKPVSVKTA